MVHGFLWMVHENFRWCTDFGPMVHEKFWMVHGFRQMVQGFRSMVHGFRPMVHGYPCTGARILNCSGEGGGKDPPSSLSLTLVNLTAIHRNQIYDYSRVIHWFAHMSLACARAKFRVLYFLKFRNRLTYSLLKALNSYEFVISFAALPAVCRRYRLGAPPAAAACG